jgi:hypothetical protein
LNTDAGSECKDDLSSSAALLCNSSSSFCMCSENSRWEHTLARRKLTSYLTMERMKTCVLVRLPCKAGANRWKMRCVSILSNLSTLIFANQPPQNWCRYLGFSRQKIKQKNAQMLACFFTAKYIISDAIENLG